MRGSGTLDVVRIGVLGAVTLFESDGAVAALPGHRRQALLAALVARAGEVVSADTLTDLLWDETEPPDRPAASLHSAVFKLRASLGTVSGDDLVRTREHAYQLVLEPGDLDASVFTGLVQRARDEVPEQAAATLTSALALWRGPAYGVFAESEIARVDAVRLEELRRTATERLGNALLAVGDADEAIHLLQPFIASHPLREAARSTLMRAMREAGRTADALDQYQHYRTLLGEELGMEPSRAMQDLQVELLQNPVVEAPRAGSAPVPEQRQARTEPPGLPGLQVRYLRTDRGNVLAHGTTGTGPPLVVVLGWVSSLDVVASGRDPRSSLLERLAGKLSTTLYDREGTGLSPGPVRDYGLEASAEELMEIIRAIGPPVSLLAMSAAGPIAVTVAARRPEWVSSLALFGTFADGPVTFPDHQMREMMVSIVRNHWRMGSKIFADLYRPGAGDDAARHLAEVFRESASADVAADYMRSMYDHDVSGLLSSVTAPTLVLHYRKDPLIPVRGSQDLATGLPNATFLPLDGDVHLPDAADLEQIEEAIVGHVRRHAGNVPPRPEVRHENATRPDLQPSPRRL
jgi:DNA-binding SARP family transcriptional activator/pimeloyl-ACP methyl ester carboxylesterase